MTGLVAVLVVVLLMLTGDHYATAGSSNYLLLPTQKDNVNANLPTVTLTTVGITRQIFNNFMDAVRDLVVRGPPVHGLLRLRDRSTVPISQRFILVELYNYEPTPITLAIDVTSLYVVGYRTGNLFYYFLDSAVDTSGIFRELRHIELPFNSSYPALQHEAGARINIPLGIAELDQSIQDLRHYRRPDLARSFIVVIQMVSEAVRFRYIENLVVLSIRPDGSRQNFRPTRTMISLENNWDTLSTSIQQSVEGRFTPSVELVNREDQPVLVSSVTPGLILNIAVMIFVCNNPNPNQLSPMRHVNVDHVMGINDDHICSIIPEPTIRISGRNGLCADVRDGSYNDGNPIILWPCKSNEDPNQLWTLKTDGTIRSNGKCMTAYGFKAGQHVMIYNCATAVPTTTKWQVWDNGTIINPESGLALTAGGSGSSRTELTVDNNIYDSRQGWLLGNNTAPIVTPIIGFRDLCLQSNYGNTVWIEECVSNKITQEWAIYPDGTIRPNGNKDNCLTWESYPRGQNVVIDPCDGGAGQRWTFTIDGSISNLAIGYVVDVKRSNLNLRQIIVYPFYNTANQIWRSWLL